MNRYSIEQFHSIGVCCNAVPVGPTTVCLHPALRREAAPQRHARSIAVVHTPPGFPRWGGELGACLTERTGFYDPYAALTHPGVDRVRTSRPFGFAAAGA